MTKQPLRHGYTTGACAAAAAKGAALMLREQRPVAAVDLELPAGFTARFELHGQRYSSGSAACYVVKDAGDDPDVTNGAQVHAEVRLLPSSPDGCGGKVLIQGGIGIGRVTKPGLAVPVGEWAINPVPRRMIDAALREVFPGDEPGGALQVTIEIPNGAELAKKTLNERLGIVGGLSILGTSGVVRPISTRAWTDTIDTAIDVALASGSTTVVLSTGRTSELVAQRYLGEPLPEEAFVMMGDHVGYALAACSRKGVRNVVVAGQFAKLVKIACGHQQTHVSSSTLDLATLARWLDDDPALARLAPLAQGANTAREVLESTGQNPLLMALVCGRVRQVAQGLAPGVAVKVLLAGYSGAMLYIG